MTSARRRPTMRRRARLVVVQVVQRGRRRRGVGSEATLSSEHVEVRSEYAVVDGQMRLEQAVRVGGERHVRCMKGHDRTVGSPV
jgi:hypothetical protein